MRRSRPASAAFPLESLDPHSASARPGSPTGRRRDPARPARRRTRGAVGRGDPRRRGRPSVRTAPRLRPRFATIVVLPSPGSALVTSTVCTSSRTWRRKLVRSLRNASSACDPPLKVACRLAPENTWDRREHQRVDRRLELGARLKQLERFSATNASPAAAMPPRSSATAMTCPTPRLAFVARTAGVTSEMDPGTRLAAGLIALVRLALGRRGSRGSDSMRSREARSLRRPVARAAARVELDGGLRDVGLECRAAAHERAPRSLDGVRRRFAHLLDELGRDGIGSPRRGSRVGRRRLDGHEVRARDRGDLDVGRVRKADPTRDPRGERPGSHRAWRRR